MNYVFCRFIKNEIVTLDVFLLMKFCSFRYKIKPKPYIALCIVLARLTYTDRDYYLTYHFGRSVAWISTVFNDAIRYIAKRVLFSLLQWHPRLNNYEVIQHYVNSINQRDFSINIWSFINGTFQRFCRSQRDQ